MNTDTDKSSRKERIDVLLLALKVFADHTTRDVAEGQVLCVLFCHRLLTPLPPAVNVAGRETDLSQHDWHIPVVQTKRQPETI